MFNIKIPKNKDIKIKARSVTNEFTRKIVQTT